VRSFFGLANLISGYAKEEEEEEAAAAAAVVVVVVVNESEGFLEGP
jgi:hypothetical protein